MRRFQSAARASGKVSGTLTLFSAEPSDLGLIFAKSPQLSLVCGLLQACALNTDLSDLSSDSFSEITSTF